MTFVYVVGFIIFFLTIAYLNSALDKRGDSKQFKKNSTNYQYERKDAVMTPAEASFYKRLEKVVDGRYYIFPQIHLSALMSNKTGGRYRKAAFQRINNPSVDYVLCNRESMKPVYAIELDDSTHDTIKARAKDGAKSKKLANINLPLVRFRNVCKLTDDQIAQKFEVASRQS